MRPLRRGCCRGGDSHVGAETSNREVDGAKVTTSALRRLCRGTSGGLGPSREDIDGTVVESLGGHICIEQGKTLVLIGSAIVVSCDGRSLSLIVDMFESSRLDWGRLGSIGCEEGSGLWSRALAFWELSTEMAESRSASNAWHADEGTGTCCCAVVVGMTENNCCARAFCIAISTEDADVSDWCAASFVFPCGSTGGRCPPSAEIICFGLVLLAFDVSVCSEEQGRTAFSSLSLSSGWRAHFPDRWNLLHRYRSTISFFLSSSLSPWFATINWSSRPLCSWSARAIVIWQHLPLSGSHAKHKLWFLFNSRNVTEGIFSNPMILWWSALMRAFRGLQSYFYISPAVAIRHWHRLNQMHETIRKGCQDQEASPLVFAPVFSNYTFPA